MKQVLIRFTLGVVILCTFYSCIQQEEENKGADANIISFTINGIKGQVSSVTLFEDGTYRGSVFIEVPAEKINISLLSPAIAISPKATIIPAIGVSQDFTHYASYIRTRDGVQWADHDMDEIENWGNFTYTVTSSSGKKVTWSIIMVVDRANMPAIEEFIFPDMDWRYKQNPIISQIKNTISVNVPFSTDLTTLTPQIKLSHSNAKVIPASGVPQDFTHPITYTVVVGKDTSRYVVTIKKDSALSDSRILEFILGKWNYGANIDHNEKKVQYTFPPTRYGNITALAPIITIPIGATISPASGVVQDFTNPIQYTVTADDGSVSIYTATIGQATWWFPTISSVSSTTPRPGDTITIVGDFTSDNNSVQITDYTHTFQLTILNQSVTSITAVIPINTIEYNYYTLQVTSNSMSTSYSQDISVGTPPPTITSVIPLQAIDGEKITIIGSNLLFSSGNISLTSTKAGYHNLAIIEGSSTSITFNLYPTMIVGSYSVNMGYKVANGTKVVVVPNDGRPRITALSKTRLVKGVDDLIITGENFRVGGENAQFSLLLRNGLTGQYMPLVINEAGTKATISSNILGLNYYPLGTYSLSVHIVGAGKSSSDIEIELVGK